MRETPDPREPYGRVAWDEYEDWLKGQPGPWPRTRITWEDLNHGGAMREAYMRIGNAVAAQAGLDLAELAAAREKLVKIEAHCRRKADIDAPVNAEGILKIIDGDEP